MPIDRTSASVISRAFRKRHRADKCIVGAKNANKIRADEVRERDVLHTLRCSTVTFVRPLLVHSADGIAVNLWSRDCQQKAMKTLWSKLLRLLPNASADELKILFGRSNSFRP
jgi:hypothetical protein